MLRDKPGIVYAEVLAERDGDAYTYTIESEYGVDIRKNLFYTLAEKGWPLIGMEALGMSLEDIFITVVDKSDVTAKRARDKNRAGRQNRARTALENDVANEMFRAAEQKRADAAREALERNTDDEDV